MSKINDLIKELCPNGVEFKKIIDIAEVGTGSSNRQDAVEDGVYLFYVRSKEVFRINKFEYNEEAIIIPGEGGIGEIFHYVNGKYALHQRAYRIHIVDNRMRTKFLYYYMFNSFKDFIMLKAVNATVTSIRKPMIEQFSVPIPPIEVQEEIIRILDKFGELEAELEANLEAELEARKSQYEFWRGKLLLDDKYSMVKISDITNSVSSGKCSDKGEQGNYPVYGSTGIIARSDNYLYDEDKLLIARVGANAGYVHIASGKYNVTDNALILDLKDNIDLRFMYYNLQNYNLNKLAKGGGQPLITGSQIKDLEIALPSLIEQKRIASILDKFDRLVNDISIGLPTEIELRRKQYEYYRNKLLSFEELSVSE